jgi:hypothetical protein
METGFLVLVIPGLDPGIASTDGVRLDPRIKSGDDEEGAVRPAESFSSSAVILMHMGRVPAICEQTAGGGWPEQARP